MLKSMGWTEEKGLGLREDGIKDYVYISRKQKDMGGIGSNTLNIENTKYQYPGANSDDLNRVLSSLGKKIKKACNEKILNKNKKNKTRQQPLSATAIYRKKFIQNKRLMVDNKSKT